jgi:hypothetical protein
LSNKANHRRRTLIDSRWTSVRGPCNPPLGGFQGVLGRVPTAFWPASVGLRWNPVQRYRRTLRQTPLGPPEVLTVIYIYAVELVSLIDPAVAISHIRRPGRSYPLLHHLYGLSQSSRTGPERPTHCNRTALCKTRSNAQLPKLGGMYLTIQWNGGVRSLTPPRSDLSLGYRNVP